ncbi:MAG: quinone-dependent dihydroorotate dehydrogenase [Rhodospirillaceae bacterium]|nr:quinone-dependent dihydroorotate dehydrogenase [Rhodospirillaceae bacterium]
MNLYESFQKPLLFALPAEISHRLAVRALSLGMAPRYRADQHTQLRISLWGKEFPNPIGMAAGFDKDCEALAGLHSLGFGFVEAGTVTPNPQPGNPKPRLFRLPEDRAIINRFGFNSRGHEEFRRHLETWRSSERAKIVGVNVGQNKESTNAIADYSTGVAIFAPLADYLVVNISSPNTPGLRDLQSIEKLRVLLAAVREARDAVSSACPLLVKIAPDLGSSELEDIARTVQEFGIDGIIATNTTIDRPSILKSTQASETGGLSGEPLFTPSTKLLADLYQFTDGKIPLIGVGGIFTGRDAYEKILAGASLVQIYTSLIYRGPGAANLICEELAQCLAEDGYTSVSEAVGAKHH